MVSVSFCTIDEVSVPRVLGYCGYPLGRSGEDWFHGATSFSTACESPAKGNLQKALIELRLDLHSVLPAHSPSAFDVENESNSSDRLSHAPTSVDDSSIAYRTLLPSTNHLPEPTPPSVLSKPYVGRSVRELRHGNSKDDTLDRHTRLGSGIEEVDLANGKLVLHSKRSAPKVSRTNTTRTRRSWQADVSGSTADKIKEHLQKFQASKTICQHNLSYKPQMVYHISLPCSRFSNSY